MQWHKLIGALMGAMSFHIKVKTLICEKQGKSFI